MDLISEQTEKDNRWNDNYKKILNTCILFEHCGDDPLIFFTLDPMSPRNCIPHLYQALCTNKLMEMLKK